MSLLGVMARFGLNVKANIRLEWKLSIGPLVPLGSEKVPDCFGSLATDRGLAMRFIVCQHGSR